MSVAANLLEVENRIVEACYAAGRNPSEVRLLPVSKTWPVEAIREAVACGYTRFGENRPQELATKAELVNGEGIEFAAIGRLQTNKVKLVVDHAVEFQALDSLHLAAALNRRAVASERKLDVLIQINTSGEPQKAGFSPSEVVAKVEEFANFEALRIQGLMTLAVYSENTAEVRDCFVRLAKVRDQLRDKAPEFSWEELSMGMSGDYELAIAEGSTCVRIGQAIFGARS